MHKKEIIHIYDTAEEAVFPEGSRVMLICVNRTIEDPTLTLLDAVRYSWKISHDRAENAEYVLAVAHGLIVDVFEAERPWLEATKEIFSEIPERHGNWKRQDGRWGFRGRQAPENVRKRYVHKRVPDEPRGHGSPLRYVGV